MNELLHTISQYFLHLDESLGIAISTYGTWVYALLFGIVFLETGIVIMPFLPGDSLLFAAGALSDAGSLNIILLFALLFTAAVLGDGLNYWIGKHLGRRVYELRNSRWLRKEHLDRTHRFYERYGAKTIVIARFVPIVRTIAPFVAGVGLMRYRHFFTYNVLGAFLWVSIFLFGGYFFGRLPFIQENFSFVVVAIIAISLLPALWEFIKSRRSKESTSQIEFNKPE
ncbi:MAG: DedA family protein [Candidatus Nomurabacteria bacterium]|nr:MAG: DedA family protein [Candidatus Nomurabacteria bacterium]